ncbi:hypothetical protein E1264_30545, partial [Actinomadura sp. KC216]|uniref:hypothetical protein n=1 Tax=Actinomadura sp. KC216 TaxID=2530370 RepID=UPI00104D4DF7
MIEDEIRWMARLFEGAYGEPPATIRHACGALPLLDGWEVPLPWGAAVAAGHSSDGTTSLYSMNHYAQGVVTPPTAKDWARACMTALDAHASPGTHILVNRELPAEMGLLTGAETVAATTLALQDLHGRAGGPAPAPGRGLAGTGLCVLLIEIGS